MDYSTTRSIKLGYKLQEFSASSEGGTLDLDGYRDSIGLPATPQGWARAACMRIPEKAELRFRDLVRAALVIGWGLPPSLMELLDRFEIPFPDIEIDPARFADDLFFCVRTNHRAIARRLAQIEISDERLAPDVTNIRGYVARRDQESVRPAEPIALFAGQALVDLSIVSNGWFADPSEYVNEIKRIAGHVSRLLIKPHPAEGSIQHLAPLLEEVPNAVLCRSNIYRILSDVNLSHVVALSSSVLKEAALFGVKTTRLIAPDRDLSSIIPLLARRWYRVPGSVAVADCLFETRRLLGRQRIQLPKSFNLRRNLGDGWGLAEFYSGCALTLSFEIPQRAASTATEVQMIPVHSEAGWQPGWQPVA